jgi:hypothetical protein
MTNPIQPRYEDLELRGDRASRRVRRFQAAVSVTRQLVDAAERGEFELVPETYRQLAEQLSGPLTGPRGGRYEPVGDIEYIGGSQVGDDFLRNLWTFAARRYGKYVRPRR